jgi:protein phosphatase PTC1
MSTNNLAKIDCSPRLIDINKAIIKTESPKNIFTTKTGSPSRLDKPVFFGGNNTSILNNNNVKSKNLLIPRSSTNITGSNPPTSSSNQPNVHKSPILSKNFDWILSGGGGNGLPNNQNNNNTLLNNPNTKLDLNNMLNAFTNSSLLNPINPTSNIQINKTNTTSNNVENSPKRVGRKQELINSVLNAAANSSSNNRRNSPLKFNSLFTNPMGVNLNNTNNNNSNPNLIVKKLEENVNKEKKDASPQVKQTQFYSVLEYSYKEEKNGRFRNSMEDFSVIIDAFNQDKSKGFFSLYDGHGGTDPVKYVKDRVPEILAKMINEKGETNMEQNLIQSFTKVDEELKFCDSENTGCTACVVYISNKQLYCANVGDSRCMLVSSSDATQLSYDHKCTDQAEVERIRSSGGIVFSGRVFGQLVLTRALGDHALKKYGVIATPFVSKTAIEEKHRYCVIASDGVWDVINNEELFNLSKCVHTADEFAKTLIKSSLQNGSKDNISCIVIKLN